MIDRIEFLISEAFIALRRNLLMTFAAVSTSAISLFLIGGLGYAYLQIVSYADTMPSKFDMRVYMKMDASKQEVSEMATSLRAIPGVKGVFWIPKDKAWALDKVRYGNIAKGIENPYPDAFKVTIKDLSRGDEIASEIRKLPNINKEFDVVYLKDLEQFVSELLRVVRWLGSVVGGLLFFTAGLLIYNAIRLTVLSRRLEIRIMQLNGASQFTIRVPFLLEGIIQGTTGGAIATGFLLIAYKLFGGFLVSNLKSDLANLQTVPAFPTTNMFVILCGIGALYGLLCSSMAVRTPLRFR